MRREDDPSFRFAQRSEDGQDIRSLGCDLLNIQIKASARSGSGQVIRDPVLPGMRIFGGQKCGVHARKSN
jgi:hypothetical protein